MNRIRTAMRGLVNKSKKVELSPEALAAISTVCKIASTINVPGVQIACTAVIELINMVETASSNDEQWKFLLNTITDYARIVEEFAKAIAEGQPDGYIAQSDELKATYARDAIADFERSISSTKAKVEGRLKDGRFRKKLGATAIKSEIEDCRRDLDACLQRFNGRTRNILFIRAESSTQITTKTVDLGILGARPVAAEEFKPLDDITFESSVGESSFWHNSVRVQAGGEVRVAKVFGTKGGKEEFEKHIKFFSKSWFPGMARLEGYNTTSEMPFLIFSVSSVEPLVERLMQLSRGLDKRKFLTEGWRLFKEMNNAARFLCSNTDWSITLIRDSVRNAAVGSDGQLMLTPRTDFFAKRDWEIDTKEIALAAVKEIYTQLILDGLREWRHRCLRPFTLALRQNARAFLEYPLHELRQDPSIEPSSVLQQWWPAVQERMFEALANVFPSDTMPGDMGTLRIGKNGNARFHRLTNINDLYGLKVEHSSKGTDSPQIYRETYHLVEGVPRRDWNSMWVRWRYCIEYKKMSLPVLASQFQAIGERYGVPRSKLVLVIRVPYELKSDRKCLWEFLARIKKSGDRVHSYSYFSSENRFVSAQWSFQESPPTEAEAAAEAERLKVIDPPSVWGGMFQGSVYYLQLEEEDIDHLEDSGSEDRIV